jgi:hypothetical protein
MAGALAHRVVYISAATRPFTTADLQTLLARARVKNARLGITGLLVHTQGSFLQFLEGEQDAVERLLAEISADKRHVRVTLLLRGEIQERAFADWTMGFVQADSATVRRLPGFSDFLRTGLTGILPNGPEAALVIQIATRFRDGHWRQHVDSA